MSNRVRAGRKRLVSRRRYLEARLIREQKASIAKAREAVDLMTEMHPEIDMDEERTPAEWGHLNG